MFVRSRLTVLVLEDEFAVAGLLAEELDASGFEVAGPFASCARALEWLATATPDLAVLDTKLADGSCQEVAAELTHGGVRFVVFSGYREEWNTLGELRAAIWVEKPASASDLILALRMLPAKR